MHFVTLYEPLCIEMTSNSIGFYPGSFVTSMCEMVTVGLTVSEKSPGQTNKLESPLVKGKVVRGEMHRVKIFFLVILLL